MSAVVDSLAEHAQARARSAEHWIVLVGSWIAVLGLAGFGLALHPDPRGYGTHEQLGFQPCLPLRLWNVPCPGCGVTTAVTLAVRGQPLASLRAQPLGLVVVAVVLAFALWATARQRAGADLWREFRALPWRRAGLGLGAFALAAWAYKIAVVRGWI